MDVRYNSFIYKMEKALRNMDKTQLLIAGITFLVINLIASLGIFVKFSDMSAYAVSKEAYHQHLETTSSRLSSIEAQLSETNRDVKQLLRYYHSK